MRYTVITCKPISHTNFSDNGKNIHEERKELYGICIRTEFVKREGVLSKSSVFELNGDQNTQSSPARPNRRTKQNKSKTSNSSGASDDYFTPPISPRQSDGSDSSGTLTI